MDDTGQQLKDLPKVYPYMSILWLPPNLKGQICHARNSIRLTTLLATYGAHNNLHCAETMNLLLYHAPMLLLRPTLTDHDSSPDADPTQGPGPTQTH